MEPEAVDSTAEREHVAGTPPQTPEATDPRPPESVSERRRRERRLWRRALLVSALLHVLPFLIWGGRGPDVDPGSALERPGAPGAGASGAAIRAVALRSAPPPAPRRLPAPSLEMELPDPVEFEPNPPPELDAPAPELPEYGRGASTGADPLDGGNAGAPGEAGVGDGGGGGDGGQRPPRVGPSPRRLVPPRHPDLRENPLTIRVFVDATGRVVPDSTRLDPPTSDEELNEELMREASGWTFEPGREEGAPIATWWSLVVGGGTPIP